MKVQNLNAQSHPSLKGQAGFSIIELVIAMTILAIGFAGLLGASGFAYKSTRDNEKWVAARNIAVSYSEMLSAQPFDTIRTEAANTAPHGTATEYHGGTEYEVEWIYEPLGTSSEPHRITVEVTYPGGLNPARIRTVRGSFL